MDTEQPQREPPLAVSVTEAARLMGVSRASAYRMVRAGDLRVVRLRSGLVRVPKAALEELLAGARP
jgi:excisionase family DNA binding protein